MSTVNDDAALWDAADSKAKETSAKGGVFVVLANDEDMAEGVFVGGPVPVDVVWTGVQYEPHDAKKHAGAQVSTRYRFNFFLIKSQEKDKPPVVHNKMKILENNWRTYETISTNRRTYKGLDGKVFRVVRSGAKGDQSTTFTVMFMGAASPDTIEMIAKSDLHDLTKSKYDGEDAAGDKAATDVNSYDPDAKIDPAHVAKLSTRLSALPKDVADGVIVSLGGCKLRDLPKTSTAKAFGLVEAAEKEQKTQAEDEPSW